MQALHLVFGVTTSLLATFGIVANVQAGIILHDVNDSSYSSDSIPTDSVLIDDRSYANNLIREIESDQFRFDEHSYSLRTKSFQNFTHRLKQEEWRRNVVGTYSFSGVNPNGSTYGGGTCIISVNQAGLIQFSWTLGQQSWLGNAQLTGRVMNITFNGSFSGNGTYTLQSDGSILGVWQGAGSPGEGIESLRRR